MIKLGSGNIRAKIKKITSEGYLTDNIIICVGDIQIAIIKLYTTRIIKHGVFQ